MKSLYGILSCIVALCGVVSASGKVDLAKIDRNMAIPVVKDNGIAWYDAAKPPFRIAGFAWREKNGLFRRLPVDKRIPKEVNVLADHSTSGTVSFATDSPRVLIDMEFGEGFKCSWHFAPTGRSGLDLYCGGPGKWQTVGVYRINYGKKGGQCEMFKAENKEQKMREFLLNLPLYNSVKSVRIGVVDGSKIAAPKPFANDRRIVIYGGSTVQGGCASRPGRAHMNIIGRHFNMEVINLGFSGSSRLEPVMAELTAAVERPAVVIIEGDRNAGLRRIKTLEEPFIATIRKQHPEVPIVVMQGNPRWNNDASRVAILAFQKEMVKKLQDAGDKNLYLWDCSDFLGDDFSEGSVDGLHPNDLGFHLMAERMIQHLTPLIK